MDNINQIKSQTNTPSVQSEDFTLIKKNIFIDSLIIVEVTQDNIMKKDEYLKQQSLCAKNTYSYVEQLKKVQSIQKLIDSINKAIESVSNSVSDSITFPINTCLASMCQALLNPCTVSVVIQSNQPIYFSDDIYREINRMYNSIKTNWNCPYSKDSLITNIQSIKTSLLEETTKLEVCATNLNQSLRLCLKYKEFDILMESFTKIL